MTLGTGLYRARRKQARAASRSTGGAGSYDVGTSALQAALASFAEGDFANAVNSEGVPPPASSDVIFFDDSSSDEEMIDETSSAGSGGLEGTTNMAPETSNDPADQVPQQNLVVYPEESETIPPLVLDTLAALMGVAFSCGEGPLMKVQFDIFRKLLGTISAYPYTRLKQANGTWRSSIVV